MNRNSRIYVCGVETLIGGALVRALGRQGYSVLISRFGETLDLTDAAAVDAFFASTQPEYVFLAAGRYGGIRANQKYPADLIRNNLLVAGHVIHSAHVHRATKLLYLASSCSYPRHCAQPMQVESLMTGPLEPTNAAYATAKLAGIQMCQAYRRQYGSHFIAGIPANAFGIGDEFDTEDAHVIGALIHRMHQAKRRGEPAVTIWGTGAARREFIFADDLAAACLTVMDRYDDARPINLGGGLDASIAELASAIRDVVGYEGELRFDTTRPDGMPLKALDSRALLDLGWRPATSFRDALTKTYDDYLTTVQVAPTPAPERADTVCV